MLLTHEHALTVTLADGREVLFCFGAPVAVKMAQAERVWTLPILSRPCQVLFRQVWPQHVAFIQEAKDIATFMAAIHPIVG